MSGTAIQTRHLSITISKQSILRDITLEIPEGTITGLLGPSGAGKTTLMRAIVGLQKPTDGSLTVLDHEAGSRQLRSSIGYMTQNLSIYTDLTVVENLEYFAEISGANYAMVGEIIEQLGLTHQRDTLAEFISGGQKTRVSLAAALLAQPRLLILDEPTVGIDPVLRAEVWKLLKKLANQGTTLLVSSHVMEEAEQCDRIILMRDGRILAHETPKNLKQQTKTTNIESAFLKLVGDKS